jgi:hypothetical protein
MDTDERGGSGSWRGESAKYRVPLHLDIRSQGGIEN